MGWIEWGIPKFSTRRILLEQGANFRWKSIENHTFIGNSHYWWGRLSSWFPVVFDCTSMTLNTSSYRKVNRIQCYRIDIGEESVRRYIGHWICCTIRAIGRVQNYTKNLQFCLSLQARIFFRIPNCCWWLITW